jgi:hypothetical protein
MARIRNRGLLLTLTEPPRGMDEEFNAWYDEEHLPERLSIPGFRSARRWISGRTYLATYELDSARVLTSRAYLKLFKNPTPWSKRCLGKCVVFRRWACEQVGAADPHPRARAVRLSFEELNVKALRARGFRAASGETIFLYELAAPARGVFRLYQA